MEFWKGFFAGVVVVVMVMLARGGEGQLLENFYQFTCPSVESVVRQAVVAKLSQTFTTVPATLRLFFHDCFVEGCDASILIASPDGDAEKDAPDNQSLAGDGFDTVVKAKQAVEVICPGVVSCADILAIASRDVVTLSGGPSFNVELGRRDGFLSQSWRVPGKLPDPGFGVDLLSSLFAANNLSLADMVALSGAHTIGFSHCSRFDTRLYSFSAASPVDPALSTVFAQRLMQACPPGVDPSVAVVMDAATPAVFDNAYYRNLINGEGLLSSDQALFTDSRSQSIVEELAADPEGFGAAFAAAMVRLGRIGVKTGELGEIRRDCTAFN